MINSIHTPSDAARKLSQEARDRRYRRQLRAINRFTQSQQNRPTRQI